MKQTMQKERGTVKTICLIVVLLSLVVGIACFSKPAGDEKTAQCASFALTSFGASKEVLPKNYDELTFSPGGMPFGVRFFTKGVLVVGVTDVLCNDGSLSPALDAGIRTKDVITKINGETISSCEDMKAFLSDKKAGESISVTYTSSGTSKKITVSLDEYVPSEPRTNYSNVYDF